jgi:hypothetical protein
VKSDVDVDFYLGEITFYPPKLSTHLHFYLQSFKCDTLPAPPPQTFKLWQFDHFDNFFFQNAPITKKKKKKNPKKKKKSWGAQTTP